VRSPRCSGVVQPSTALLRTRSSICPSYHPGRRREIVRSRFHLTNARMSPHSEQLRSDSGPGTFHPTFKTFARSHCPHCSRSASVIDCDQPVFSTERFSLQMDVTAVALASVLWLVEHVVPHELSFAVKQSSSHSVTSYRSLSLPVSARVSRWRCAAVNGFSKSPALPSVLGTSPIRLLRHKCCRASNAAQPPLSASLRLEYGSREGAHRCCVRYT
jgi:hypothetical protein